jgi:hypothetical protein
MLRTEELSIKTVAVWTTHLTIGELRRGRRASAGLVSKAERHVQPTFLLKHEQRSDDLD